MPLTILKWNKYKINNKQYPKDYLESYSQQQLDLLWALHELSKRKL